MKSTRFHLDILGHNQFEHEEFEKMGHSLGATGRMTQESIFDSPKIVSPNSGLRIEPSATHALRMLYNEHH